MRQATARQPPAAIPPQGYARSATRQALRVAIAVAVLASHAALAHREAATAPPSVLPAELSATPHLSVIRRAPDFTLLDTRGQPVRLVPSMFPNPKVTVPGDLPFIESLLGGLGHKTT